MTLRNLFIVTAVLCAASGLGLILFPGGLLGLYGLKLGAAGAVLGQLFGAALLGVAVIAWLARGAGASPARNAIISGFFVCSVAGFVVSFVGRTLGEGNALVWANVALYFMFAAAYGYFRFLNPEERG